MLYILCQCIQYVCECARIYMHISIYLYMFTHAHTFLQEKMGKILGAQIGVCTHACMHVLTSGPSYCV